MRLLIASAAVTLLFGCNAKQAATEWQFRPEVSEARLVYNFGDGEGTTFIGSCEGEPTFIMTGGRWDGAQFTLIVDNNSWTLPTSQGEHGHYLPVDVHESQQAIANAKKRIIFEVGSWRREIRPAAPLKRFVSSCS